MNDTFIFQGRIYNVKLGEIVYAFNNDQLFGNALVIGTDKYELVLNKVAEEKYAYVYKIVEITDLSKFNDEIEEEDIKEEKSQTNEFPDLTKLKKDQLINMALSMGYDVTSKMTKKDLIELIEK